MQVKSMALFIVVVGVCALIGVVVYNCIPKTAFVDNQRLFEAFQGRKELEERLEQEFNQRKLSMDSLGLNIRALQARASMGEQPQLQAMIQRYQQMQETQQQEYQYKSQAYTEAIWKQISTYTIEYGEVHNYDYVFGIAGSGSLMFGKPHYDITEDVIQFVNKRYAGK